MTAPEEKQDMDGAIIGVRKVSYRDPVTGKRVYYNEKDRSRNICVPAGTLFKEDKQE
jgi:hypothetical protein